jgi:hypothetical protein
MKKLLLIPAALIALGTLGASYAGRSAHAGKPSQSAQYWYDPLAKKYLLARTSQVPKAAHYLPVRLDIDPVLGYETWSIPAHTKNGSIDPNPYHRQRLQPPQYSDLRLYDFFMRTHVGWAHVVPGYGLGMPQVLGSALWAGPDDDTQLRRYKHDIVVVTLPNGKTLTRYRLDDRGHILPQYQTQLGVDADGHPRPTARP